MKVMLQGLAGGAKAIGYVLMLLMGIIYFFAIFGSTSWLTTKRKKNSYTICR